MGTTGHGQYATVRRVVRDGGLVMGITNIRQATVLDHEGMLKHFLDSNAILWVLLEQPEEQVLGLR